jgi:superfamily I DNA/RNA helicase
MIRALIDATEKGRVPRAQYSAILIDEGHDFEPDWFRLVVQMIDPHTNSLLLLYDDAQSIYGKQQKFSWASVGIQAKGRTTILKLNYRNTAELLAFAYDFVKDYLEVSDDEHPLIKPEMIGRHGPDPVALKLPNFRTEVDRIAEWLKSRCSQGVPPSETAVLYRYKWQAEELDTGLRRKGLEVDWITRGNAVRNFNPASTGVRLITMHSSKGLEFNSVAIPGIDRMPYPNDDPHQEAKLLYVAMTRATEALLLTYSGESAFTAHVRESSCHKREQALSA